MKGSEWISVVFFQDLLKTPDVKIQNGEPSNSETLPDAEPLLGSDHDLNTRRTPHKGVSKIQDSTDALEIKNGTFSWDLKGENIVLSDINLKIPKGMVIFFRYFSRKISFLQRHVFHQTTFNFW